MNSKTYKDVQLFTNNFPLCSQAYNCLKKHHMQTQNLNWNKFDVISVNCFFPAKCTLLFCCCEKENCWHKIFLLINMYISQTCFQTSNDQRVNNIHATLFTIFFCTSCKNAIIWRKLLFCVVYTEMETCLETKQIKSQGIKHFSNTLSHYNVADRKNRTLNQSNF